MAALNDLKGLPQDAKIKYIVDFLESSTKQSISKTGNYDKYYNKNGILSGPLKQISNGIPLTDEICKPDYRMVRIDKDKSTKTPSELLETSEAVCIKFNSLIKFLKLWENFVVTDTGLCDGFFSQRDTFEKNKEFFNNLVNVTSGAKLDCAKYYSQFDALS